MNTKASLYFRGIVAIIAVCLLACIRLFYCNTCLMLSKPTFALTMNQARQSDWCPHCVREGKEP